MSPDSNPSPLSLHRSPGVTRLRRCRNLSVRIAAILLGMGCLLDVGTSFAAEPTKAFDIPSGNATDTLKKFSEQSGLSIMFAPERVEGVVTREVIGEMPPPAALSKLLAGTALIAVPTKEPGAYAIRREGGAVDPNDNRAAPSDTGGRPANKTVSTATAETPDDPVTLSPFEVREQNRGYYASNTMSGTRLNSRIEDLAASITVITKEQMQDFALLDMNDIFSYEAGTEGLGNYTDFEMSVSGAVTDNSSLDPLNANRIRGLGPANTSFGNFETSGRVPLDPIDIDGVEISRGPNSSIFGLGNPSGTVNSVPSSANLTGNRSQLTLRADSNKGFRTTLDFNRVLREGKLAVRGSAVYQRTASHLEPSNMDSVRLNALTKFRPFKSTTLNVYFSDYRMHGTRANTQTPSDGVSVWLENGRPAFDPVTGIVTVDGRAVPLNTSVLQGVGGNIGSFIDRGRLEYLAMMRTVDVNNPTINVGNSVYREGGFRTLYTDQPMFTTALPITDRALYDWGEVNLAAGNYFSTDAQTTRVTLDQIFLSSPRQNLAAQVGWFREQVEQLSRIAVGIPNQHGDNNSNPILIDVNIRLLDGQPNPYFGRPYIETRPYSQLQPVDRDTYRAQLAYQLDLRNERSRLRWLGLHKLTGYAEYKDFVQRRARWEDTFLGPHAWFPPGVTRAGTAGRGIGDSPPLPTNILRPPHARIYLGDADGGNVDYGSSYFPPGDYVFEWGNNAGANWKREPVVIGPSIAPGATGAGANTWTLLKTQGAVAQSHFLGGRIVTTLGWRHDESFTRVGGMPQSPDGIHLDYPSFNSWEPDWTRSSGRTTTKGVVVRPLRWLSLSANRSDSFRPAAPTQNVFLEPLPHPNGVGKDYGVGLNLFDGKLVLRFNRYITRQLKTPNGPSGGVVARVRRMDFEIFQAGTNPTTDTFTLQRRATDWVVSAAAARGQTLSADQIEQQVAGIMKLPVEYLREPGVQLAAADDTLARGFEFEANYNPTPNWSMKLNVTQQEAINERIAPEVQKWVNERLAVWQSIIDPITGEPWFTSVYPGLQNNPFSASRFLAQNITSQVSALYVTEGLSRPQIRKYRANLITNFRLAGITDHKFLKRFNVGGAVRWEDKGSIGYYGVQQPPAIVTDLDHTRPIYDKAHTYVDLLIGYRTRLFSDKINARFQLNVRNVHESGRLQPVAAFPDGTPYVFRIIEPRVFILSATFDL